MGESMLKITRGPFRKMRRSYGITPLGVAMMTAFLGAGIGCKSSNSSPSPTPPPLKVTQSGTVKDIFSDQPLVGMIITGADSPATTNSRGEYTITYTKGTAPVLTMTKAGYVTRTTFPAHGPDYHNIPDSFNVTEFNNICRNGGQTHRWSTDPAKKPKVYITSLDRSAVPSQLKSVIKTVVNTYLPQITNNALTSLSIIEELDYSKVPTNNAFVFLYSNKDVGNDEVDDNSTLLNYVRVELGGSNAGGSAHFFAGDEVLHEAGHGVGFTGHASTRNSIMWQPGGRASSPTTLDIQNGTVLYDRPPGNSAPDNDPSAVASAAMMGVMTYEQALKDQQGTNLSNPLGAENVLRSLVMPPEWVIYENTLRGARLLNEEQLRIYGQGRTGGAGIKK